MLDETWRKSPLSAANGQCLEARYIKSSKSGAYGECVEVHQHGGEVHVRDSKNPDGPYLTFTPGEWSAFLHGAKAGEFDLAGSDVS